MLLSAGFGEALVFLQSPELIREDTVIPNQFPECPDSTYRTGYDWLYRYERDIAAFLAPWLNSHRYELIGEKGIICEALSNAFCHGHNKDPLKPIFLKVFLGARGLLVRVTDSGKGFDARHVIQSYLEKKMYYHTAGNGIHLMATSKHFGVFFDPTGSAFHMLYTFGYNFEGLKPVDAGTQSQVYLEADKPARI